MKLRTILLSAMLAAGSVQAAGPYAGQESRDIKALSADDLTALLGGKGMGLAKAAELNGYPGPSHVLELARDLRLSDEQRERTQALFRKMESNAIALGRELVAEERRLDQLFAQKAATPESVHKVLARIGELQGKVRAAHLEAHLHQVGILTPEQVARYVELRGYAKADGDSGHRPGHKH
jgi:hypothetical protein